MLLLSSCSVVQGPNFVSSRCESAKRHTYPGGSSIWLVRTRKFWSDGSETIEKYVVKPDEPVVTDEHYLRIVNGDTERLASELAGDWTPVITESDPCR